MRLAPLSAVAVLSALLALGGCAGGLGPGVDPEPAATAAAVLPPAWQAPLPHEGRIGRLHDWWSQFDDELLVQLIDAAQAASPSLASAASRIEQARATRVAAGAALLPTLDASASLSRGRPDFVTPLATVGSVGLQAGWELDLFGGRRAARDAAQARVEGAQAAWHDARVSVAAEVASAYTDLRACEAQVEKSRAAAASRAETARLTELSRRAGFEAPANAALARASAA
ncbi:MAG TPA: TolC family protein, partial [Burkholderiaceae bacterium]|nr:TolC family protein [Burkholderiaceae bacterium]